MPKRSEAGWAESAASRARKGHLRRPQRQDRTEREIPYGARALRVRSPHSSPSAGEPRAWRRGAGRDVREVEVREMRDANTILGIHRERGEQGLPLERVYRHLFNPDLFLGAYNKIYRNAGAMTRGVTEETVDGMLLDKITKIIALLRQERWQWKPVRRLYIPKANGKLRPLGLPTWSDKLVQEVLRVLLEAYYEP